jgi:hypothetical protein
MTRHMLGLLVGAGVLLSLFAKSTTATIPYTPVALPPGAIPRVGPGVIDPKLVFGKEYSHDFDSTTVGGPVLPPPPADPEQLVAWDGIGGTTDGIDYSGSRGPNFPREQEVDAIANSGDALYRQVRADRAHLVFSHDDTIAIYPAGAGPFFPPAGALVPPIGPVPLSNGDSIGGTGEISIEEAGVFAGFEDQGLWAAAPIINGMPTPQDFDGLEVWGPEPGVTADSNMYSLESDIAGGGGVSVWRYDLVGGASTPYIFHPMIVTAVESLLGVAPTTAFNQYDQLGRNAINVDALMAQDLDGVPEEFGPGDSIIFSISQIVNPQDADGFYATGSELFTLDMTAAGGPIAAYLKHGGHAWDHLYTLGAMAIVGAPGVQRVYIDINAIEAIGELVVPEPTSLVLLAIGLIGALKLRRRK